jgi:hypothetical protein
MTDLGVPADSDLVLQEKYLKAWWQLISSASFGPEIAH